MSMPSAFVTWHSAAFAAAGYDQHNQDGFRDIAPSSQHFLLPMRCCTLHLPFGTLHRVGVFSSAIDGGVPADTRVPNRRIDSGFEGGA